jgi:hypothetical protein
MVIIETSFFTKRVRVLLSDEEYRGLQSALITNPLKGALIRGSGGIRKVRWALPGRGKSGGVRVIYYWAVSKDQILMLSIYAKNERDNLTQEQLRILRQVVKEEFP